MLSTTICCVSGQNQLLPNTFPARPLINNSCAVDIVCAHAHVCGNYDLILPLTSGHSASQEFRHIAVYIRIRQKPLWVQIGTFQDVGIRTLIA